MSTKGVKRIMLEARELAADPCPDYSASPLETDAFEWHATVRGAPGTDFAGGLYHLRILLPPNYPFTAPDIMLLTPSGRFEVGRKICIDGLTSFHQGSWQPAWGVRTAIVGLMSFWNMKGEAMQAIGAMDQPPEERRRLAKLSRTWCCPTCGESNAALLPDPASDLSNVPEATAASFSTPDSLVSSSSPSPHATPSESSPTHATPSPPSLHPPPSAATHLSLPPSSASTAPTTLEPVTAIPGAADLLLDASLPSSGDHSMPPAAAAEEPSRAATPPQPHPSPPPTAAIAPLRPPPPSAGVPAPLWFDALFGLVLAALVVLLARRML